MTKIYYFSRLIFIVLLKLLYRVRIYGQDNIPEAPYLVTSNHASYLDPLLVGIACYKNTIDFMTKRELFDVPFFGAWCRAVGCIELNRGNNSIKGLRDALGRIKRGRCVSIFPEGGRTTDGSLREAKKGAGFIIAKARVPVVPIYIEGSLKAMPKGGRIFLWAKVNAYVGKPVRPEELLMKTGEEKEYGKLAELVMERIARIKESVDNGTYRVEVLSRQ
jgi:1-acyl-sn-glycerol-3-phosphate acyltransferase